MLDKKRYANYRKTARKYPKRTRPADRFVVRKPFQAGENRADMAVFNAAVQLNKILMMAYRALGQTFAPKIADPLGAFVVKMVRNDSGSVR